MHLHLNGQASWECIFHIMPEWQKVFCDMPNAPETDDALERCQDLYINACKWSQQGTTECRLDNSLIIFAQIKRLPTTFKFGQTGDISQM